MNMYKSILSIFLIVFNFQFVLGNDFPFEYEKTGSGKQTIIFVPGFACSGEIWKDAKSKFEKQYTVYTLTMSGFAGVKPKENISFKYWEKGIADFIISSQIDRPIIIGHSMGGSLALAIAADFPKLIGGAVVVDALPCLSALMNPSFKSAINNDCSAIIKQMTDLNDNQFKEMQQNTLRYMASDTILVNKLVTWSVTSDRRTFGEMYCDFSNTDLRDALKNIQCPVLILLEPQFQSLKSQIDDQYKNLSKANIKFANKGFHFIMIDDKDWFLKELADFLIMHH